MNDVGRIGGAIDAAANMPPQARARHTDVAGAATRLRVAYLVNQYPKVSHSFIRREILALERQGVDVVRIAVRGWDAPLADPADERERSVTHYLLRGGVFGALLDCARAAMTRPGRLAAALRQTFVLALNADRPAPFHFVYLVQAARLALWLGEMDVDHLHAHFGTNPAEVALLAHIIGGQPYSFTVHGPDEFDRGVYLHLDAKIAHAKFVAAVNSFTRSQLMRRSRQEDWHRIKVVHCGLDALFAEAKVPDVDPDNRQFVCVGRLCEQKGQLLLVEAFARLIDRYPEARLVLAGDGEMREEIEARIATLGIGARVRITGWISEAQVRDEITAARAMILPSFAESLPVVIMEAMALRRPVISTFVAGIPELVVPAETGWLVAAGSVTAIVGALEACLATDAAGLKEMGDRARARVLERHSADREAQRLLTFFTSADAQENCEWTR